MLLWTGTFASRCGACRVGRGHPAVVDTFGKIWNAVCAKLPSGQSTQGYLRIAWLTYAVMPLRLRHALCTLILPMVIPCSIIKTTG